MLLLRPCIDFADALYTCCPPPPPPSPPPPPPPRSPPPSTLSSPSMSPPVPREVDTLTPVPVIAASMSTVFHDDNAHSALWLFVAVTDVCLPPPPTFSGFWRRDRGAVEPIEPAPNKPDRPRLPHSSFWVTAKGGRGRALYGGV